SEQEEQIDVRLRKQLRAAIAADSQQAHARILGRGAEVLSKTLGHQPIDQLRTIGDSREAVSGFKESRVLARQALDVQIRQVRHVLSTTLRRDDRKISGAVAAA